LAFRKLVQSTPSKLKKDFGWGGFSSEASQIARMGNGGGSEESSLQKKTSSFVPLTEEKKGLYTLRKYHWRLILFHRLIGRFLQPSKVSFVKRKTAKEEKGSESKSTGREPAENADEMKIKKEDNLGKQTGHH